MAKDHPDGDCHGNDRVATKNEQDAVDESFMHEALSEAKLAFQKGEVPIGAVIIKDGVIIARGHNLRETQLDPTAHAEVVAIRKAASALGSWRLTGCTLYATIEPCPMCAGALLMARVDRVVYGAADMKAGAVDSLYDLLRDERLNHRCQVRAGVLQHQCAEIMQSFFRRLRGR